MSSHDCTLYICSIFLDNIVNIGISVLIFFPASIGLQIESLCKARLRNPSDSTTNGPTARTKHLPLHSKKQLWNTGQIQSGQKLRLLQQLTIFVPSTSNQINHNPADNRQLRKAMAIFQQVYLLPLESTLLVESMPLLLASISLGRIQHDVAAAAAVNINRVREFPQQVIITGVLVYKVCMTTCKFQFLALLCWSPWYLSLPPSDLLETGVKDAPGSHRLNQGVVIDTYTQRDTHILGALQPGLS